MTPRAREASWAWLVLLVAASATGADPARASERDERTMLVALVHFRDTAVPAKGPEVYRRSMKGVAEFFDDASYGRFGVRGIRDPARGGDVFGWHRIPMDRACDRQQVRTLALEAVRARDGVDPEDYDFYAIVADFPEGCLYFGSASATLATMWIEAPRSSAYLFSHEIGHAIELGHANFTDCGDVPLAPSGCRRIEYGDGFDVMGRSPLGHLNAPHMEQIGWFAPSNLLEVTRDGTFELEPIETPTPGLKAIKIRRSADDFLYVEYRQPLGADAHGDFGTDVFRGAVLHVLDRMANRTLLIDATPQTDRWAPSLHVGKTFTDPVTGTAVTVVSATTGADAKLTVRVRIGSRVEFDPPTVGLTEPDANARLAGTARFGATARDASGVASVAFVATDASGAEVELGVAESAGPDGAYRISVDTGKALRNGTWRLAARATDVHGNVAESGEAVPVEVRNGGDTTPPEVSIRFPFEGTMPVPIQAVDGTATDAGSGIERVDVFLDHNVHRPVATASRIANDGFWAKLESPPEKGPGTVMARAVDRQGNTTDTPWRSFNQNDDVDRTPPAIVITSPGEARAAASEPGAPTATVTGPTVFRVDAPDNVGTVAVEFRLNTRGASGAPLLRDTRAPFTFELDRASTGTGTHYLQVRARDAAGNTAVGFVSFEVE